MKANNHKKQIQQASAGLFFLSVLVAAILLMTSCAEETTVPYGNNQYPYIERFVYMPNDTFGADDTLWINCYAEDPEGEALYYYWFVPEWYRQFGHFVWPDANPVAWKVEKLYQSRGEYLPIPFQVRVADNYRFTATGSGQFLALPPDSVPENPDDTSTTPSDEPRIKRLIAEQDTIAALDTMIVRAEIEDGDDPIDSLDVQWFYSGGFLIYSAHTELHWMAPHDRGNYRIILSVSDKKTTVRDSISVYVGSPGEINRPPAISRVYALKERLAVNDTTQVICEAIDPDEDPITYRWSVEAGRIIGGGSRVRWQAPGELGVYTIEVEVSDEERSTLGFTRINVVPDTTYYYQSDYSNDDVTGEWAYMGLLTGMGDLPPTSREIAWDSLKQKMAVTFRSNYSAGSFRLQDVRFTEGSFSMNVEATSTQFGWVGILPKFYGVSNFLFIGINFFQQTCEALRCINGELSYLYRYEGQAFHPDVPYALSFTQKDGVMYAYLNDILLWQGDVIEPFLNPCPVGVAVYGLGDSGPAYYDDLRVSNP